MTELPQKPNSTNLLHNHHELGKNSSCEEENGQEEELQIEEIFDIDSQQEQRNLNNDVNSENISNAIANNNAVIGSTTQNIAESSNGNIEQKNAEKLEDQSNESDPENSQQS